MVNKKQKEKWEEKKEEKKQRKKKATDACKADAVKNK